MLCAELDRGCGNLYTSVSILTRLGRFHQCPVKDKAETPPTLGSPQKSLGIEAVDSCSPEKSWELGFIVHLFCAKPGGRAMATACLNLCFYSHFPHRQLGFSRSHQHSKNSKTEVIPLGSLHKSLCTNDFFAQERAVNLFSVLSVLMRHDDYPFTPLCLFSLGWLDYAGAVSLPRLARQKPVERWGHWTCSLRLLLLGD